MILDLKQGNADLDTECPACGFEIELEGLPRWNTECKCPNCGIALKVGFDFTYDGHEERDIYHLEIKK